MMLARRVARSTNRRSSLDGAFDARSKTANVPRTRPSFEKKGVDQALPMPAAAAVVRHSGGNSGLVAMFSTTTEWRRLTAEPHAALVGNAGNDCVTRRHASGTRGPAANRSCRPSLSSKYTEEVRPDCSSITRHSASSTTAKEAPVAISSRTLRSPRRRVPSCDGEPVTARPLYTNIVLGVHRESSRTEIHTRADGGASRVGVQWTVMNEPLYRAVLGASADPVALLDKDGTILFVSDSIERLTGFAPAILIGRSALDQVHPDHKRRVHAALVAVLGRPETPIAVEYRSQHQDGSWHDREVVGVNRLHDPDIGAIVVNYRDTTARRCAEAALEECERLHQSTFDEAPIGVAHMSLSGRFLRVNRWLCHVLGYSTEELRSLDFMAITHPDDVKQDVQARQRLIAGMRDRYTREKQYRRKDGRFVPVSLAVSIHRNQQGDAVYFIAVIEDLTERKRLEHELRQAQKMEALGRLAGGIAHDFNNLLVAIGGYADLVVHGLGPDHPVGKDVAYIQAAAKSAAALTRQLLAFSRRQILKPQVLDLNHVLRRVESLLRRVIGEDITLVMTLAARLRRVHTDPGQVEQIIMNLAVNARDAMPNGGVLTIETANVDLDAGFVDHHRGSAIGPHVMIAASDTGSGMDAETLAHVFEPFFTTKPVGRGTGLGLSTVYGIVKQSQGSIWVYSEVGYGSTFKIYLPGILI